MVVVLCRLIEEVREKTNVVLETDEVYMNTQFTDFIRQLVLKSRGTEEVKLEYDAVGFFQSFINSTCNYTHTHTHTQAVIKANGMDIECPHQCFINNEFIDASDGKTYNTISPTDGSVICTLAASGAEDVEKAVRAAKVGGSIIITIII